MTRTYRILCSIVFAILVGVAVIATVLLVLSLADVLAHGGQYPWWAWPVLLVAIGASLVLGYFARLLRQRLVRPAA
jgi:hypothetical protein